MRRVVRTGSARHAGDDLVRMDTGQTRSHRRSACVRRACDRRRQLSVSARCPIRLGRDVWIRAIEILPGNRSVVHHVLVGIDDPGNGSQRAIRGQIGELGGYAPGKNAVPYPADSGILLRKEAGFRFQMHYTPNGKAATDVTRVG